MLEILMETKVIEPLHEAPGYKLSPKPILVSYKRSEEMF